MNLQNLETEILAAIGFDRYSSLSVDTDPAKVEDFSLLHRCVNNARDDIRLNTIINGILQFSTAITTVANQGRYTFTDTNFDIPVKVFYINITDLSVVTLDRKKLDDLSDYFLSLSSPGAGGTVPDGYIMVNNASGQNNIILTPGAEPGGDLIRSVYKPILTDITASTGEDIIMRQYPNTVMKLATAYAFQFFKKDMANFEKWLLAGFSDFRGINLRETSFDNDPTMDTEAFLALKRSQRVTI